MEIKMGIKFFALFILGFSLCAQAQPYYMPDEFGYVQDSGFRKLIKERHYDFVFPYHKCSRDGKYYARILKKDMYGILDQSGNEVLPARFLNELIIQDEIDVNAIYREDSKLLGKKNRLILLGKGNGYITGRNKIILWDSNGRRKAKLKYLYVKAFPYRVKFLVVRDEYGTGLIDYRGHEVLRPIYRKLEIIRGNGYYMLRLNKKCAVIDSTGKLLTDTIYEDIYPLSIPNKGIPLFVVRLKGKWGLVSRNDTSVTGMKYRYIRNADNRFYTVAEGSKHGVIGTDGRILIPLIYDSIRFLPEQNVFIAGTYHSRAGKGKYMLYGLISSRGDTLSPIRYHYVDFDAGYASSLGIIRIDSAYGIINKKGEEITPLAYERPRKIAESGMLYYRLQSGSPMISGDYRVFEHALLTQNRLVYQLNYKMGMTDLEGRPLLDPVYDSIIILEDKAYKVKYKGCWGIVDRDGNELVPKVYDRIYWDNMNAGSYYLRNGNKTGYIRDYRRFVFYPVYNQLWVGDMGRYNLAIAGFREIYGVVDSCGNALVPFVFETMMRKGFMLSDRRDPADSGAVYKYSHIRPFRDGFAVAFDDSGAIIIDSTFHEVSQVHYQDIYHHHIGYYRTFSNGLYGILNGQMQELHRPAFEATEGVSGYNSIIYTINGLQGIMDMKGVIISPAVYEKICEDRESGLWKAKYEGRAYLVDRYGNRTKYNGHHVCW